MNNDGFYIAQATPSTGVVTTAPVAETNTPKETSNPTAGTFQMMLPLLLIAVFYILLIRPQQKKEKEKQKGLKALSKGDKVVTRGGIWGTVVGMKEEHDIVVIKIAEDVKIEVSKNAIEVINPQIEKKDKKDLKQK